jgi:hypothetical protein
MKVIVGKSIGFAALGVLFMANSGQAVTIDSLDRSLTLLAKHSQSTASGDFIEGLSWPGTGDYDSKYGISDNGARVYQDSSILNVSDTMTVGGLGGLNVWWPNNTTSIDQRFTIQSNLLLTFTPLTNATYSFWDNSDGGMVKFSDITANGFISTGSGFLLADHTYQIEADASISNWGGVNYGAYWNMGLEVTEVNSGTTVPEPTTMLLFGTGLAGLAAVGRSKKVN